MDGLDVLIIEDLLPRLPISFFYLLFIVLFLCVIYLEICIGNFHIKYIEKHYSICIYFSSIGVCLKTQGLILKASLK